MFQVESRALSISLLWRMILSEKSATFRHHALALLTILLTGFGRFPGSPVNPSALIARRLARRRRTALAPTRRLAHVFATRYDAVDRDLPALLARERPDI